MNRRLFILMLFILPLCGVWQLGQGAYIHTKAILAQVLLETAWSETLKTGKEVKPWPWADTWPVGRLSVPRLDINRIVLAGASGQSLAFGPGHLFNSAQAGAANNIVIAGHRDTHFSFLRKLKIGDRITFQDQENIKRYYEISGLIITDESNARILESNVNHLILITCYPFNAITTGGPLRFIVFAAPVHGIEI